MAFTSERVRDSFRATGAISKGEETGQFYPFPDMRQMMNQCKISWNIEDMDKFKQMSPLFIASMIKNGYHSKDFLEGKDPDYPEVFVDFDTDINGVEDKSRDTYSLNQMHLQRFVLFNHIKIRNAFEAGKNSEREKQIEKQAIAIEEAKDIFENNQTAKAVLCQVKLKNKSLDEEKNFQFSDCTLQEFFKVNKSQPSSFIMVRENADIFVAKDMKLPRLKGKVTDKFEQDNPKFIVHLAYTRREAPEIASIPSDLGTHFNTVTTQGRIMEDPTVMDFIRESTFVPAIDWLNKATILLNSVARKNATGGFNLVWYESNVLYQHLQNRLRNLVTMSNLPENKKLNHWIWRWQRANLKRVAAILKLSGYVLPDRYIVTRSWKETLFRDDMDQITELVNSTNGHEIGSYMYIFKPNNGIIKQWRRAGSASVGLQKRGNDHIRSSLQNNDNDRKSKFYRAFPHLDSERKKTSDFEGYFQELEQRVGISFDKGNAIDVQSLFEWSDYTESCLDNSRLTLAKTELKTRMICYLFETVLQLCLDEELNVSRSYGNELFLGVHME